MSRIVRENPDLSGKSQGILKSSFCGNPGPSHQATDQLIAILLNLLTSSHLSSLHDSFVQASFFVYAEWVILSLSSDKLPVIVRSNLTVTYFDF